MYIYIIKTLEVIYIKIDDISLYISDICMYYYFSHNHYNNILFKNIDMNKLRGYIAYNINTYFNMKYKDWNIHSFDVSSHLHEKRYNIYNATDIYVYMQPAIDIMTQAYYDPTVDFISINVVPFDGIMIYGSHIISIIESYIY